MTFYQMLAVDICGSSAVVTTLQHWIQPLPNSERRGTTERHCTAYTPYIAETLYCNNYSATFFETGFCPHMLTCYTQSSYIKATN